MYRNRRLILAGSWLGLPGLKRDPACNLARIRLDIPPSRDFEWKIDIRKSSARPPAGIRNELVRIARDVRSRARKIALGKRGPGLRLKILMSFSYGRKKESCRESDTASTCLIRGYGLC